MTLRPLCLLFSSVLALTAPLSATVITSNLAPIVLGQGSSAELDFDFDGYGDILFSVDGGYNVAFSDSHSVSDPNYSQMQIYTSGFPNAAVDFGAGSLIGPSLDLSYSSATTGYFSYLHLGNQYGHFDGTRGYAGVDLRYGTFSGGAGFTYVASKYGWIDLAVDSSSPTNTLTIYGWAFESTFGAPISTGTGGASAVPDTSPGWVAFATLGLLGIAGWRRRSGTTRPV